MFLQSQSIRLSRDALSHQMTQSPKRACSFSSFKYVSSCFFVLSFISKAMSSVLFFSSSRCSSVLKSQLLEMIKNICIYTLSLSLNELVVYLNRVFELILLVLAFRLISSSLKLRVCFIRFEIHFLWLQTLVCIHCIFFILFDNVSFARK